MGIALCLYGMRFLDGRMSRAEAAKAHGVTERAVNHGSPAMLWIQANRPRSVKPGACCSGVAAGITGFQKTFAQIVKKAHERHVTFETRGS
jgi:hypothetical protein